MAEKGELRQNAPPWMYRRNRSFPAESEILGRKRRPDRPVSGQITTSFDLTPVSESGDVGTISSNANRSIRPSL